MVVFVLESSGVGAPWHPALVLGIRGTTILVLGIVFGVTRLLAIHALS